MTDVELSRLPESLRGRILVTGAGVSGRPLRTPLTPAVATGRSPLTAPAGGPHDVP